MPPPMLIAGCTPTPTMSDKLIIRTIWNRPSGNESPMLSAKEIFCLQMNPKRQNPAKKVIINPVANMFSVVWDV